MKKLLVALMAFIAFCDIVNGQSTGKVNAEPIVGQTCPDILFSKTDFYKRRGFSISDLKGKWVVLDFWDRFCGSCIGSFPSMSEMQKEFVGKVQFVMVTYDDPEHLNRSIFSKYHQKLNLAMPCAYNGMANNDGVFQQFNVGLLPHIIVIDPKGIVRAITFHVEKDQIQDLLDGNKPEFQNATYADGRVSKDQIKYDSKRPLLVNGNGGADTDFEYRSLISKWNKNSEASGFVFNYLSDKNRRLEVMRMNIGELYRMAYLKRPYAWRVLDDTTQYGKVWPDPLVETKDSSRFIGNRLTGENMFCYSVIVPPNKASNNFLLHIMQNDLKNYFDYEVVVETKKMPIYKLVIIDSMKAKHLLTKGGPLDHRESPIPRMDLKISNLPMETFTHDLIRNVVGNDITLFDETGIKYNIDIYYEYYSREALMQSLKKNGLGIVSAQKEMKVLVIRDPKPTTATTN